jgi:hypothetical protein
MYNWKLPFLGNETALPCSLIKMIIIVIYCIFYSLEVPYEKFLCLGDRSERARLG